MLVLVDVPGEKPTASDLYLVADAVVCDIWAPARLTRISQDPVADIHGMTCAAMELFGPSKLLMSKPLPLLNHVRLSPGDTP